MISRRHGRRQGILAIGVIAFTAAGLALPLIVADNASERVLPGSSLVAAIRDRYTLTSPVRLLASPLLIVESGSLSVSSAQASRARTGEAVTALLASGSAKLVLDGAVLRLDAQRRDTAGQDGQGDALAPLLKTFLQLAFDGLGLRRSTIIVRQSDGSEFTFADIDAEIGFHRRSMRAKGSFWHKGQRLSFDTTVGLLDRKAGGGQVPVKASIKGELVDSQLEGTLVVSDAFQLSGAHVVMSSPDLRRVANWLGAGWPAGPGLGYFRAEGSLDWADRTVTLQKAAFSLDGNLATGTLAFSFDGPRPSIEGTLALSRLDLSRYLTADDSWASSRQAVFGPSLAAWLERPATFSLPLLPLLDADLRISSVRTSAGSVDLGRSAATISLKSGRLLADIAEVEIDSGARGLGQISVDMSRPEPRFTVRGKIEGLETSGLAGALLGHNALSGRADLMVDVSGSGDTGEQILASLTGKASLTLPQGGEVGFDIPGMLEAAPASQLEWGELLPSQTSIDRLDVRLQFAAGTWTAETMSASMNDVVVSASGRMSLPTGAVDLEIVKLAPATGEAVRTPPSVMHRLALRGSWLRPTVLSNAQDGSAMPAEAAAGSPAPELVSPPDANRP